MAEQKQKMKRLKTRKERSHLQGCRGERFQKKSQSHHHQRCCKEKSHLHRCCQSSSHCTSRRNAAFARIYTAPQEPSIITDSRLLGHHGLFSHEVKSIDIERLLSEQKKLEKVGQHRVQRKRIATFNPFPSSPNPSPGSISAAADNTEGALNRKKTESVTCVVNADGVSQEDGNIALEDISQERLATPTQKQFHQFGVPSESDNTMLSSDDRSYHHVLTPKSKRTKPPVAEKQKELHLHFRGENESMRPPKGQIKSPTREHTPKNKGLQHIENQSCCPSPVPLKLLGSPMAVTSDSSASQQHHGVPDSISKSVRTVAARLSSTLKLPLPNKKYLVEESREVLFQALWDRHGPLLQDNLHTMQQHFGFGTDHGQDMGPPTVEATGVSPTDAFRTTSQMRGVNPSYFNTQKRAATKMRRRQQHSSWLSPSQPCQYSDQATGWTTSSSVENYGDAFGMLAKHDFSSQFCTEFQPFRPSQPCDLPPPSHNSHRGTQAIPPQSWDIGFSRGTTRGSPMLDCFEKVFFRQNKAVRESSSEPHYHDRGKFPFLEWPDEHLTDTWHTQKERNPFELDRQFQTTSSARAPHCQQSNQLHPFYCFSQPSSSPLLRSPHNDMMYCFPCRTLGRGTLLPSTFLLSPEHWSFPPMRLY